jgi:hypothetical protein
MGLLWKWQSYHALWHTGSCGSSSSSSSSSSSTGRGAGSSDADAKSLADESGAFVGRWQRLIRGVRRALGSDKQAIGFPFGDLLYLHGLYAAGDRAAAQALRAELLADYRPEGRDAPHATEGGTDGPSVRRFVAAPAVEALSSMHEASQAAGSALRTASALHRVLRPLALVGRHIGGSHEQRLVLVAWHWTLLARAVAEGAASNTEAGAGAGAGAGGLASAAAARAALEQSVADTITRAVGFNNHATEAVRGRCGSPFPMRLLTRLTAGTTPAAALRPALDIAARDLAWAEAECAKAAAAAEPHVRNRRWE